MGLKINIEGETIDFSDVNIQIEENDNDTRKVNFELSSPEYESSISFPFPFPLVDQIPPQIQRNSSVYIFKNQYYKTNDIIQLRIEPDIAIRYDGAPSINGHIGYFFKLQVFLEESGAEIFSSVRHSLLFALTAVEEILKDNGNVSLSPQKINLTDELTLENLYDSEIVFLVINNSLLRDASSFHIEQYLCSLYKKGFYLSTEHGQKINFSPLDVIKDSFDSIRNQSPNKCISVNSAKAINFQEPNNFYKTLIQDLIIKKAEFPTSFIALFQIIELLKDDLLKIEMSKIRSQENITGFELKNKIAKISSDASLIRKLLGSEYSSLELLNQSRLSNLLKSFFEKSENEQTALNYDESVVKLLNELKKFLDAYYAYKNRARKRLYDALTKKVEELEENYKNAKKQENFAVLLYKFRNTLVHNYRRVTQVEVEELLEKIKMHFEYLIVDLMLTYEGKSESDEKFPQEDLEV